MKKILIADDSMTARMIVKRCLQMIGVSGCEFLKASGGAQALVGQGLPDLVFADLNMPNLDGEAML